MYGLVCSSACVYIYICVSAGGRSCTCVLALARGSTRRKRLKQTPTCFPRPGRGPFFQDTSGSWRLCCSLPRANLCSLGLGCATGCGWEERQAGADGPPLPPFAWLASGSYLHTTSDLIPARSLQTARGAHWSSLPWDSSPLRRLRAEEEACSGKC